MLFTKGAVKRSSVIATIMLLGILFLAGSVPVAGQQQNMPQQQMPRQENVDVTDDELEVFALVVEQVDSLNQKANQQMVEIIQNNDLAVEQYNQIMEQLQSAEDPGEISADEETVERAIETAVEIRDISTEVNQKINTVLQNQDLPPDRYDMIMQLVNSDPQTRQRFEEIQKDQ